MASYDALRCIVVARNSCRRGDLNPHELALTRPSTYEGLSGECRFLLFERAPCGRTFGIVRLHPDEWTFVCHQACHQRLHPLALALADLSIAGCLVEGLPPG
jgi:hypothetical protein